MIKLLKRIFSVVMFLDKADLILFRFLSPEIKGKIVRMAFDLFIPIFPKTPVPVNGAKFFVPKDIARSYVLQKHEPEVTHLMQECLKPGMSVIDVGANIGYHAIFAAKQVGPAGKVFAVEPDRTTLDYLRNNIRLNKLKNIVILPFAAGRRHRVRDFHRLKLSLQNSFYIYAHSTGDVVDTIQVDETPLDNVIRERVDFVKIDVEGSEIEALEGMRYILTSNWAIQLLVEWNPRALRKAGYAISALPEYLKELGFNLFIIDEKAQKFNNIDAIVSLWENNSSITSWYNLYAKR